MFERKHHRHRGTKRNWWLVSFTHCARCGAVKMAPGGMFAMKKEQYSPGGQRLSLVFVEKCIRPKLILISWGTVRACISHPHMMRPALVQVGVAPLIASTETHSCQPSVDWPGTVRTETRLAGTSRLPGTV